MQLGFVTTIFPELSLDEVLGFAAAEQFDTIEVMCWPVGPATRKYAGVTHIDVVGFTQAQADDTQALCQRHGVGLSALGYYPNILSGNAEESRVAIDHLKQVIRAARLLGLSNVNTFIGNDHTQTVEHNFGRFREVWPDLIRLAEDEGIRIGIENCPMLFGKNEWPGGKNLFHSPEIWRRMFEAIPSDHFGINFDPSHFVFLMMDYVQPMYEFRHKIFHTHAKDTRIDHHRLNQKGILTLDWYTPKIPGLGDIHWAAWISALSDIGFRGSVSIEVEDDAFMRDLDDRKRSLRIARNVLRPLIG